MQPLPRQSTLDKDWWGESALWRDPFACTVETSTNARLGQTLSFSNTARELRDVLREGERDQFNRLREGREHRQ